MGEGVSGQGEGDALWPVVLVTGVLPGTRWENMPGARMSYHSLRVKGSTGFFLPAIFPFFPSFLFLPTAILALREREEGGVV